VKKFLCVGEPYKVQDGSEKMSWKRIGELFEAKTGKLYAKLYMHPGILISVFDDDKKDQPGKAHEKKDVKSKPSDSKWGHGPLASDEEVPEDLTF
jgi:hypothetical protein